jgi:hypothetical protein
VGRRFFIMFTILLSQACWRSKLIQLDGCVLLAAIHVGGLNPTHDRSHLALDVRVLSLVRVDGGGEPSHEVINALRFHTGNQRASKTCVTWWAKAEAHLQPTTAVWRSYDVGSSDAAAAFRVYDGWAAARRRDAPAAQASTEGHAVEVGDVDPIHDALVGCAAAAYRKREIHLDLVVVNARILPRLLQLAPQALASTALQQRLRSRQRPTRLGVLHVLVAPSLAGAGGWAGCEHISSAEVGTTRCRSDVYSHWEGTLP